MNLETDWEKFSKLMNLVSEEKTGKPESETVISFKFSLLEEFEFQDISRAILYLVKTCKFKPDVSDIISYLDGSIEERSAQAWNIVIRSVMRIGTYESVQFGDPRIHYAIDKMGGWPAMGQIREDEVPFREKDFRAWYRQADKINTVWSDHELKKYLPGIHEAKNLSEGKENIRFEQIEGGWGGKQIEGPINQIQTIDCGRLNKGKYFPRLSFPVLKAI